ncbi:AsmA-like C-terminal region-containing protein [Flavobacterium granuli]|uniref:AsmA protein n=1 Tax=Flavobacterium granuli TaxID=280093 RepID=A0ABU1S5G9_9FLAO|nr:AsmA-like C-terminal region-containing protein [Flavobacterium granuli]MDR6846271.1 AsmA protein [Flavobacterium granuli]
MNLDFKFSFIILYQSQMAVTSYKSIFFKIIKYTGITLVVLLALMFITPLVFSDKIKEQVKKTANEKLNGELNYSEAKVSFFSHFPSLTLTLSDFKLNGSAPFQNEKFITADEVAFGINLSSLVFGKTIKVDQIFLSNSLINVKVNKKGEANYNVYIAEKETTPKEESETGLKLEEIEITNSKLIYDDQSANIHVDAFGFNYLGNGDFSKAIFALHSKAKIEKLNVIYENEPYLMNKKVDGDLITKINTNSLSFVFEQNDLFINKLLVDFTGKFDFLKDGYDIDFKIKSNKSNLNDLFTAFPPKYVTWLKDTELKGNVDLLLTLKGKYIAAQNLGPDLNLNFKVKGGFVNYKKSAFPVSNLNMDIAAKVPSLNPELLELDAKNVSLNIGKNYLKTQLKVNGMTTPDIDLVLKSQIDLEKLNRAFGVSDIELKGMLVSDFKAKGKYDQKKRLFPNANGTLNLKNGFVKTPYYPNPITDINVVSKVSNQKGTYDGLSVMLKPAGFTFEGEPFLVEADLKNFDDLNYDIKAKGTLNISKIYKVFSQKGLDVDGFVKADLELKGIQSYAQKGDYSKLHNKGTLELRNINVTTEYLPKSFLIKEGIFRFNQDKMSFNTFLASYGESDFKLNGYLQNVFNFMSSKNGVLRGSFTLNSKYLNIDEFMSSTSTAPVVTTTAVPGSTAQPTVQEKGVILIPSNLDLQFYATAHKINYQGLILQDGKGAVKIKDGKMLMQNTGFNLIGCNVAMNAAYQGFTPKKAVFEYEIKASEFDIKRAYKEVKMFKEMASAAENAEGIVSLDYKIKGRLNQQMMPVYPSLIGGGVLSIKDVKVKGMKMFTAVSKTTDHEEIKNPELSKVDIKSTVKNNIITIERFKFKFAGFRPRIEGTSSLDGKLNIKMRLGLPPLGIIGVPLTVTGTKDNPKVKVGKKGEEIEETQDTEE